MRSRRRSDRYEEDDYQDDRPARRRNADSSGSSLALILGLTIGGVLLGLVLAVVGVTLLVRMAFNQAVSRVQSTMPGMPPASADWSKLQRGMTYEQVVALYGQPAQDNSYEDIHVIHADVTQEEVKGPDGRQKPVRHLTYFKGMGQMGFVSITLVDGKVYKFKFD